MRHHPLLVWGVDSFSGRVARKFREGLGEERLTALFSPEADKGTELRDAIAQLREQARGRNLPAPSVTVFAAGFAADGSGIAEVLGRATSALEVVLPGSQSIALVVLLPPITTGEDDRKRSYGFFVALEALAGESPYLDAIFVHQLSPAGFENPEADDTLHELLRRELADAELEGAIRGAGYQAVRGRAGVAGRKCCYSTTGCVELSYAADDTVSFLREKFRRDVFHAGLMDPGAVPERRAAEIREQTVASMTAAADHWSGRLPPAASVTASGFVAPVEASRAAEQVAAVEEEAARALARNGVRFEQDLADAQDEIRTRFLVFLADAPERLSAGRTYLDTLGADALPLFEQRFCRDPLIRSLEEMLAARLPALMSAAGAGLLPPRRPDQPALLWMERCIASADSFLSHTEAGAASPLRFLTRACQSLLCDAARPCEPALAPSLVRGLAEPFVAESGELFKVIEANRARVSGIEHRLAQLPASYGWAGRVFTERSAYRAAMQEQRDSLAQLAAERAELEGAFRATRDLFSAVVNETVLPHLPRARVYGDLQAQIAAVREEFAQFTDAVARSVPDGGPAVEVPATATRWPVATAARVARLYVRLVGGRSWREIVDELLAFRSRAGARSYDDCATLSDHFAAGAAALVERMADFSASESEALRKLNALDVIEIEGPAPASEYLAGAVEHIRTFLDFSPATAPLVAARQVMNTTVVARSSREISERLPAGHAFLFSPRDVFLDSGDPNRIDLTCLIFGFPAFLIQNLVEGRKLSEASPDLWPLRPAMEAP